MGIIDTIYSSTFYMTTIIMVWTFGCVGLAFLNPFKNKTLNFIYKGTMYVVAGLIMVMPMMFYYGLAHDFTESTMGKTTFCLVDRYERGGDGPGETVTRLTVLDKKTGERKERRYIGYTGHLLGQRGDTVVYLHDYDLVVINAATLEGIYSIKKEEWGQKFAELQDGADQVGANQNYSEPKKLYLTIQGKNGNRYWFEPYSKKLLHQEPTDQRITGIYCTGYDLYEMPAGTGYQRSILRQDYLNNSTRKKIAPGDEYKRMFGPVTEESFIEPMFLGIDTVKKCFVFRHYKTTDRKAIWIEAKDFQFKTLWKKDSEQLKATDSYNTEEVGVSRYENGLLYFNMGGFVICMDPLSGKQQWNVRL